MIVDTLRIRFHPKEVVYPHRVTMDYSIFTYQGTQYNVKILYFIYEYNDATACCWFWCHKSSLFGYHKGDLERIYILYDNDGQAKHVHFKSHYESHGIWKRIEDCEKADANTLVAYAARGGHAFFPSSGIWWRLFGIANDLCSQKGEMRDYFIGQEPPTNTVINLPQTSSTFWTRFFVPVSIMRAYCNNTLM